MNNLIKSIGAHFTDWGGRYLGSFFIAYIFYLANGEENFIVILFFAFILVAMPYAAGYEKAKSEFFKPEPSDDLIRSQFGKILEILSQIIYNPTTYPESLLPFPREKIREILLMDIQVYKLLVDNETGDNLEKYRKNLRTFEESLSILDLYFIKDDDAVEANIKFKNLLNLRK